MKRLFQVNKPSGKIVRDHEGAPMYFNDKKAAKGCRDSLNNEHSKGGYTVSPGPDHNRFNEQE